MTVEYVQLERFESLVYRNQFEEAGRELLTNLKLLYEGGEFSGQELNDQLRTRLYTRLAAAITALMVNPLFQLSQEGFELLALEHATLSAVFQASVFQNTDHLLRQIGTSTPDADDPGKLFFPADMIAKLLLVYSLDSEIDLDFEEVFRSAPHLAMPAYLGMLSHAVVLSPRACARRQKLLTLGPLLESTEIGMHMSHKVVNVYMVCSYADGDDKHDIKRSLNHMMRSCLEKNAAIPAMPAQREIRQRPTMMIPIESFSSLHAMFRCYAPSIRRLRERFRLVMIGRSSDMDKVSKQLFDQVIELEGINVNLPDVLVHLEAVKPDIIYYPSLGMATWWTALSTVRLAPIQIATLGHPATTHSSEIDYMLVPEIMPGNSNLFSEIVLLVEGNLSMATRHDAAFPDPVIRQNPEILRIAIPAMACKLNASFLATCQSIARKARRPVEFHFFPAVVGLSWFQIRKEIKVWLPEAVVYPRTDYNEYLRNMSNCDIHLSTFPFGGANSNVDSMRLAIPMVTLEGGEVHSQTDAGMLRQVGMPERLITHSIGEFEETAVALIGDDIERMSIARLLLSKDISVAFGEGPENKYNDDFLQTVCFVYANHESIVNSERRYWSVRDRRAFEDSFTEMES